MGKSLRSYINSMMIFSLILVFVTFTNSTLVKADSCAKINTFTIDSSSLFINKNYTISASGSSNNGVLYKFFLADLSSGKWYVLQDYSEKKNVSWIPKVSGKYEMVVHCKDKLSTKEFDDYKYQFLNVSNVNSPYAKLDSFSINNTVFSLGKTYTITTSGTSLNGVLYKFYIADLATGKWSVLQDYSEVKSVDWTPKVVGKYEVVVHAKDKLSTRDFDDYNYQYLTVNQTVAKLERININNTDLYSGKSYTISAIGASENGVLYKFWMQNKSTGKWIVLKDYSENNNVTWIPNNPGGYRLVVHCKDKLSMKEFDDYKFQDLNVKEMVTKLDNLSLDSDTFFPTKEFTISASGDSKNQILYKFWIGDLSNGKWTVIQDYSNNNSVNWIVSHEGKYRIVVHAKDKNSNQEIEDYKFQDINVLPYKAQLISLNLTKSSNPSDSNIYSIIAKGVSPNKVLYQFHLFDFNNNNWQLLQDYSEIPIVNWSIPHDGYYRIVVHSKDSLSNLDYEDYKVLDFNYVNGTPKFSGVANINKLSINYGGQAVNEYFPNNQYNVMANAYSNVQPLYQFYQVDVLLNKCTLLQDYGYSNQLIWTPPYAGRFQIIVHCKDVTSNKDYDDYDYFYLNVSEIKANASNYGINEKITYKNYSLNFYEALDKQISNGGAVYDGGVRDEYGRIIWLPASRDMIEYYLNPINFINGSNGKYQFLQLTYSDCVDANAINAILPSNSSNVLYGMGQTFINAGKLYGVNPIYLVSHALLETGNGTSALANGIVINNTKYYNMFGIHAYDSDPNTCGSQYAYTMGWDTPEKAILGGAQWIYNSYLRTGQNTLYKMRWNPSNPGTSQYATDVRWAYNQIYMIKRLTDKLINPSFTYEIPVYR